MFLTQEIYKEITDSYLDFILQNRLLGKELSKYNQELVYVVPRLTEKLAEDTYETVLPIVTKFIRSGNNRIIITGEDGSGKTSFLLWLQRELALLFKHYGYLPVYLKLTELANYQDVKEWYQLIKQTLREVVSASEDALNEFVTAYLEEGRFIFLLDDYDEILHYRLTFQQTPFPNNRKIIAVPVACEGNWEKAKVFYLELFNRKQRELFFGEKYPSILALTGSNKFLLVTPLFADMLRFLASRDPDLLKVCANKSLLCQQVFCCLKNDGLSDEQILSLHPSFTDYFSACCLKMVWQSDKKSFSQYFASFKNRQALVFLSGLLENDELIREILQEDDCLKSRLLLAGYCLANAQKVEPALMNNIIEQVIKEASSSYNRAEFYHVLTLLYCRYPEVVRKFLIEFVRETEEEKINFASSILSKTDYPEDIEDLLKLLADDNSYVCQTVVQALGSMRAVESKPAFLPLLSDPDSDIRIAVIRSLGEIGAEEVTEQLIKIVNDEIEETQVRWSAGISLAKINGLLAVNELTKKLAGGNEVERRLGIVSLGFSGSLQAVDQLIKILEDYAEEEEILMTATESLIKLGIDNPEVYVKLMCNLTGEVTPFQTKVAEILGRIGDPLALDYLLMSLYGNIYLCWRSAEALGRIGDSRAVREIIFLLQFMDRYVRQTAAESLGQIASPFAMSPLIKLLDDSELDVRRAAVQALGFISDEKAVEPLCGVLARSTDDDRFVKRAVAEALGRIGSISAKDGLLKYLSDEDAYTRQSSVKALGRISASEEELFPVLSDEDEDVRCSAVESLGLIGKEKALHRLKEILASEEFKHVQEAIKEALQLIIKKNNLSFSLLKV